MQKQPEKVAKKTGKLSKMFWQQPVHFLLSALPHILSASILAQKQDLSLNDVTLTNSPIVLCQSQPNAIRNMH